MHPTNNNLEAVSKAQEHLEQAYVYYDETGKLDQALQQCGLAIQFDPNLAEAHNLKGNILAQLGKIDQAIVAFGEAVHISPDFESARQNLLAAQQELRELPWRKTQRTILWGMLGLGIGFSMAEAVIEIFQILAITKTLPELQIFLAMAKFGGNEILLVNTLLYAIGSGIGFAILGKASGVSNVRRFAFVGATTFAFMYVVTGIAEGVLLNFINISSRLGDLIRFAITGASAGAMLGIFQKDWKQTFGLALAGAISLGFDILL